MIQRCYGIPCFYFYFLFKNNIIRERFDENVFRRRYGFFSSKVSFQKYLITSPYMTPSRIIWKVFFHKMSYMEMSDVRSINDDAKFDADVKFGDKGTSQRYLTQGDSQDVNAIDQVFDGAFMGSAALVLVDQEEFERCRRVRKPTQKGLEYQSSLLEEKQQNLKSKLERKSREIDDLLYSTKNRITMEESMLQFNDMLKMFDSAQNQYLQLRDEKNGAGLWFENIDNWVFELKRKICNWL